MKNEKPQFKIEKDYFLPAITTLSAKFKTSGTTWQDKIKEIDELHIERVAVFPTCLDKEQRQEMYDLLEKTKIKEIPFVHIRSDMALDELEYFVKRFKTQAFNTHTEKQWPLQHDLSKFKEIIFIENAGFPLDAEEIKSFAGICLDFSHLENDRIMSPERFKAQEKLLYQHKIGCNHIAAILKEKQQTEDGEGISFDRHYFKSLDEFDYLKKYPQEWFSQFCAIELENSLAEQLKVIDYIVNLLT